MALTKEETLPIVDDAVLDHIGEVWAAQDEKPFQTFLAYLTYRLYARERRN